MADYDIFISYRNTDDNGNPTRDVVMAESLYKALREKGYNPFFSKESIDNNGRSDYVTLINNALESAKIFVAVGSSRKNLTSRWVKREISMFSALMMREEEGARTLLTYRSEDFSVDELPATLADLQSYADEKAVVRFIDIVLRDADGFRNGGDGTQILYAEESVAANAPQPMKAASGSENDDPLERNLQIGDTLDHRYQILTKIGQGGTSQVYLALDTRTNRKYAVKELRKTNHMDFNVIWESIQCEIALMKLLDYPVFPKLVDVFQGDGNCVFVMEYVEGEALQQVLKTRGALDEESVLSIARQLGQALDYLHTRKPPVIYRDLKPGNIILQPGGTVKVLDFGTAREYKENATSDTTCLGTIGYAAPEQFGGMGQTDGRTDIYNLGATLYHLVTGKNPAEPPFEILPIRQINPELSAGLEVIIQKCIQKDPNNRYQSAKELLNALDNVHKLGKRPLLRRKQKPKKTAAPKPKKAAVPKLPQPQFRVPDGGTSAPGKPVVLPLPSKGSQATSIPPPVMPIPKPVVVLDTEVLEPLQPDPELKATMEKLAALDPEAKQLVRQLIDRLSQ